MKNVRYYSSLSTRHQYGLTLVEIMVALVISMFLIAGVIQLFLGSKQTYRFHDAASRLQENGRLALDTMTTDIRMAGFQYTNSNAIEDNANVITSRWIDGSVTTTPAASCSGSTNCSLRRYSIQPRTAGGAVPTCPSARTSLFLQRDNAAAQELVEGVESMQILYGVCADTDGDARIDTVTPPYATAANVANWGNVCSVRVHLLLVSLENNIVTQPQTVLFPADTNTVWPVNDLCLRQSFSTTVAIRNRMP